VLYLLHGGAGGNSAQWTSGGGTAEEITAGAPLIVVMPDGGKVGWFTNWLTPSPAQRWADFYLDQVVPWVDANFRTVATKQGRAIAGLSMGGYGAVRLAQDRPDLFASVASFSGAVDLGDAGTRMVVVEQSIQNGLPIFGAFGSPFFPFDPEWNARDPMRRATRLAGLQVLLYAGAGSQDFDILERTMGQSADRFSRRLSEQGVANSWWMYGRPGSGCDGGHNFGCWNFALADALPKMLTVLQIPAIAPPPPGTEVIANGGFEQQLASWSCAGTCGADGGGLSRTGAGNGWVRSDQGWNDLHQTIAVVPGRSYTVTAWIRTSQNSSDGFVGLRTPSGQVIGEQHFAALGGYTPLKLTVNAGSATQLVMFAGSWASGDTWLQLDDVSVVGN
jgi:S-formylglutathione hydrolase FrmB